MFMLIMFMHFVHFFFEIIKIQKIKSSNTFVSSIPYRAVTLFGTIAIMQFTLTLRKDVN